MNHIKLILFSCFLSYPAYAYVPKTLASSKPITRLVECRPGEMCEVIGVLVRKDDCEIIVRVKSAVQTKVMFACMEAK